jgi:hypothetical protein
MRTRLVASALLSVALGWSLTVAAKPAKPAPLSVTSLVQDFATGVAPRLQIQSDQLGTYPDHRKTCCVSIITTGPGQGGSGKGAGDWELNSWEEKTVRTFYLDFSQPIPGSGPGGGDPIAVPSGRYVANILLGCELQGNDMLTQAAGSVVMCPLNIEFPYTGSQYHEYRLHMNPGVNGQGTFNYPGTNYVKVTCIFPSSGPKPCSQWTLEPSGVYIAPDMTVKERNDTELVEVEGGTEVSQGHFYFSFQIVVMNP